MPIASYTHDLKAQSGKSVYIVRMPNGEFMGKRFGVSFMDGEARFSSATPDLAMRFDEEFGYEVILPKGHKRWKLAAKDRAGRGVEVSVGSGNTIEDADDGGDDSEANDSEANGGGE